jgi:hypothetical protein
VKCLFRNSTSLHSHVILQIVVESCPKLKTLESDLEDDNQEAGIGPKERVEDIVGKICCGKLLLVDLASSGVVKDFEYVLLLLLILTIIIIIYYYYY